MMTLSNSLRTAACVSALGLLAACTATTSSVLSQPTAIRSASSVTSIAYAELRRLDGLTAYDAVERYLPQLMWIRSDPYLRSPADLPQVYAGDQWLGDITILRSMSAASVFEVRYLRPMEALQRHGRDAPRGAIEVVLLKRVAR